MLHKCSTLFRTTYKLRTLSWCQISGKSRKEFTVIELTRKTTTTTMPINSRRNLHTHSISKIQGGIYTRTAFQEAFREDFEYSDFFRDH